MGEDADHNRGRRKGATLLRALVSTFKWNLTCTGMLMVGDSAVHILQVGGHGRGAREREGGGGEIFLHVFSSGDNGRGQEEGEEEGGGARGEEGGGERGAAIHVSRSRHIIDLPLLRNRGGEARRVVTDAKHAP